MSEIKEQLLDIAEYDGWEYSKWGYSKHHEYHDENGHLHIGSTTLKNIPYNTSYDVLMPVVKKVGDELRRTIDNVFVFEENYNPIRDALLGCNQPALFTATHSAIKFLKRIKPTTNSKR